MHEIPHHTDGWMPHVVVVAGRRPLRSFWFLPRAWLCEWSGIREVLPACVGLQCSYAVGGYPVGGEEYVMCVMGSSSATYSGVKATATFVMLSPRIHLDFGRLKLMGQVHGMAGWAYIIWIATCMCVNNETVRWILDLFGPETS